MSLADNRAQNAKNIYENSIFKQLCFSAIFQETYQQILEKQIIHYSYMQVKKKKICLQSLTVTAEERAVQSSAVFLVSKGKQGPNRLHATHAISKGLLINQKRAQDASEVVQDSH